MWWMAAQAAISYIGASGKASMDKAQAEINTRMSREQAKNTNKIRGATNEFKAAEGHMARWAQAVNNSRRLDAGASSLESAVVNYQRQAGARTTQRFSDSIREAEAMGAAAARQGASGVTGAVSDAVNGSVALRDSIARQQARDFEGMASFDQRRRQASIMSEMIGGLDQSLIFDALDYNTDVGQVQTGPSPFMAGLTAAAPALMGMARNVGPKSTPGIVPQQAAAPITASKPVFSYNLQQQSDLLGSGRFQLQ